MGGAGAPDPGYPPAAPSGARSRGEFLGSYPAHGIIAPFRRMIMLRDRIRSIRNLSLTETIYAIAWKLGARFHAPKAAHQRIFHRIYATNAWGDPESRSGPGSTRARGEELRPALLELMTRHSVTRLLDAPCGDFNWIRELTAGLTSYVGVDIVEELVTENNARYGDARHQFLWRDLTRDPLSRADLILCRDALIHFSFSDIFAALANFKRSGSELLLTTSFIDHPQNEEIRTGGWRPLNLQAEPFRFPEPIAVIDDIPSGNVAPGKRLCLWKIASLPSGGGAPIRVP